MRKKAGRIVQDERDTHGDWAKASTAKSRTVAFDAPLLWGMRHETDPF